jgi:nucleoside-diphosphate-sugar epimerase
MKSILLAGGAGYVGSVLSSHFLKKGYKVTVLDNFIYHNQRSVVSFVGDENYRVVHGDIGSNVDLEKACAGITDVVILAGLVGDPITKKYPEISDVINNRSVKTCIDFFERRNIDKLIFISTCSNYGLIGENELADEDFELRPLSLYAKAKVENEKYLLDKKDKVDYGGVILRFATAFGVSPRMRFDLSISEFTRDIYFGNDLLVYDENTWRPYCHVRDFARLIDMVLSAEKSAVNFEVFNAGGDKNNFTKKMIIDEILLQVRNGRVQFGQNGSDPRNYKVSFAKVKSKLGFEPAYSVRDGIEELIGSLRLGLFADSIEKKELYGNYVVDLPKVNTLATTV